MKECVKLVISENLKQPEFWSSKATPIYMANFISWTALKFIAVWRHPVPKYFHLLSAKDSLARDGLWLEADRFVLISVQ